MIAMQDRVICCSPGNGAGGAMMAEAFSSNVVLYPPGGPTMHQGVEFDHYLLACLIVKKPPGIAKQICEELNADRRRETGDESLSTWQYVPQEDPKMRA